MVWARLANRLGMALNDNPRIANTLMIVAMLLMMSAGFIFGGTITYLTKHWEEVPPYLPWLSVTPFRVGTVPYFMATGNMGTALVCLSDPRLPGWRMVAVGAARSHGECGR